MLLNRNSLTFVCRVVIIQTRKESSIEIVLFMVSWIQEGTFRNQKEVDMSRQQIIAVGDSAALLLPQKILDLMGVHVNNELDVEVVDRKLILRPLNEVEREQKLKSTTQALFERRKSAYQRLAEGRA